MKNELTVKKIIEICNGILVCGDENVLCKTFTKDTRTINKGDTYIGIKGEKFNGNDFYKEAFEKGANCVILEKETFKKEKNIEFEKPIILVENAIDALKKLGIFKRNTSNAYFVGVTGSVGKTSTRDMIYSVLKEEYKTLKTEGNYNNNIGVPLTLLRLENEQAAVIEMGMNALGEIDCLTKIAQPHISVITNVGTAHIGELGSRENILKAKLEIKNGMDQSGILIINNDNDLLHKYYEKNKEGIITIGIEEPSDFQASEIEIKKESVFFQIIYKKQKYAIKCPIPSIAFVYNSLVAFAVGTLLHISPKKIKKGIENYESTKNRLEIFKIKDDITVINDAYNASLDSMKSSLEILKLKDGKRKIAVLGNMLELGEFSKELHEQVGSFVFEKQIDMLITVGEDAKYIAQKAYECGMHAENIYRFLNNKEAIELLKNVLNKGDVVLLKASNGLHFIEIAESLKKEK